jgi:hypothetical protein
LENKACKKPTEAVGKLSEPHVESQAW